MRKFKAINTGGLAVGFTLDMKAMQKAGFSLMPEDLPVLAGAPTHQAADLSITLQVTCHFLLLLKNATQSPRLLMA